MTNVLITSDGLRDLMRHEPVVLIDTRDAPRRSEHRSGVNWLSESIESVSGAA